MKRYSLPLLLAYALCASSTAFCEDSNSFDFEDSTIVYLKSEKFIIKDVKFDGETEDLICFTTSEDEYIGVCTFGTGPDSETVVGRWNSQQDGAVTITINPEYGGKILHYDAKGILVH